MNVVDDARLFLKGWEMDPYFLWKLFVRIMWQHNMFQVTLHSVTSCYANKGYK